MPSPPSYGCCTRVNFVLKKHLLLQMNLPNSGLKNRSIKKYWLIFTVLKFPLGLQFSHNLTKFKIIKYISTIYIMTTTCTYLQQLTQVSDVAHGPLVSVKQCVNFVNLYHYHHYTQTLTIYPCKNGSPVIPDLAVGLDRRQQVDAILLNFSKAFDKAPHHFLAVKIHHNDIRDKNLSSSQSCLAGRNQQVDLVGSCHIRSSTEYSTRTSLVLGIHQCPALKSFLQSSGRCF